MSKQVGRIIKVISNDYTVLANQTYLCKPRGKFRQLQMTPLVGDLVVIDDQLKMIEQIKPRSNELIRPSIANVDQAIIVTSLKDPDFSPYLLDKLLVMVSSAGVKPIICFTKLDLLTKEEQVAINHYITYYKQLGYPVVLNTEDAKIRKLLAKQITVLAGQSGAGKSTLLNRLDPTFNLQTAPISQALGRGKHTTRLVQLLPVSGGLVADTPGFSALDLNLPKEVIRDNFVEFNQYRQGCEYRDCNHIDELNCLVKAKVKEGLILPSRYNSYIKMIKE